MLSGSLLLDWTDRAGLLVLDGSLLGCRGWMVDDGDLETKLELGLGCTIELLVDRGVCRV